MSCKNMAFGKKKPKTKEKVIEKVTVAPKVAPKPKITNVYSADFNEIDKTIESIKKEVRKQGTNEYACRNIFNILQDALKKVILSKN